MKKTMQIFDEETGEAVGVELVAQHIERIADSMAKLHKSRVTQRLIVALIADDTKLAKGTIECVLDSFYSLEKKYLKPKNSMSLGLKARK